MAFSVTGHVSIDGTVPITTSEPLDLTLEDDPARQLGIVSAASLPLPTNAAKETGGNLASIAGKDFATSANQATVIAALAMLIAKDFATEVSLVKLALAQGASGASTVGPMVQGFVSDTVGTFDSGVLQPLSLTTQGRLRVSSVESDIDKVWQGMFNSPWSNDNAWEMEDLYV